MNEHAPPGVGGAVAEPDLAVPDQVTALYLSHKGPLLRFLTRSLGSSRDAEDVAHETFARLLAAPCRDRIESPIALLKRIALNIVRDGFRSERYRRAQMAGIEAPLLSGQPDPGPERVVADRQRLSRLRAAIDALPPRCREVFVLHKMHGKSQAEVAAALGISRNMVERHVIRAYAQLRDAVADPEDRGIDKEPPCRA